MRLIRGARRLQAGATLAPLPSRLPLGALAALLSIAIALGGCSRPAAPTRSTVLVIIDTLRADRLGCYGFPSARTPSLDRLARRSSQFETAVSQVPVTAPSISTILTGALPPAHGVRDNGMFALDESMRTLAETFAGRGYRTGAFVSAAVLDAKYGLDRGFEKYDDDVSAPWKFVRPQLAPMESAHQNVERRGMTTVNRAIAWTRTRATGALFLTVHLFDPHDPYDGPLEYAGHPYDAEVAYVDRCVGSLIRALERDGRLEETVVAVTSDHGEALGEHGESTHGFFVYDATVRVPWILRSPEGRPRVVRAPVRHVDLAPTLLELSGLPPDLGHGESQAGLVRGDPDRADAEPAYVENLRVRYSYHWAELVGVRSGRWKLIRAPRPELYDLDADPQELDNRHDAEPQVVARLDAVLEEVLADASPEGSSGTELAVDEETRRQLEALGYVGAPAPDEPGAAPPDPKDAIAGFESRQRAKAVLLEGRMLAQAGHRPAALAKFQRAVELAPEYALGWLDLGNWYLEEGEPATAAPHLSRAVELDPSLAPAWTAIGLVAWGDGRDERARECLEKAHARTDEPWARNNLLELYVRTEAWDDAIRLTEGESATERADRAFVYAMAGRYGDEARWLRTELPPRSPTARYRGFELEVFAAAPEAFADLERGRFGSARAGLEAAHAHDPENVAVATALATVLAEVGEAELAESLLQFAVADPILDAHRQAGLTRVRIAQGRHREALALTDRSLQATNEVHPAYVAPLWLLRGRAAARLGRTDDAARFYTKALDGSYGRPWEAEALAGGGRPIMARPAR